MHCGKSVGVERQLAVEVSSLCGVVSHPTSRPEPAQSPNDPILWQACFGGEARDVDAWFEGQQRRYQIGVVGGVLVSQIPKHATFPREAATGLRTQCEHQSRVRQLQLPHAGGSRGS